MTTLIKAIADNPVPQNMRKSCTVTAELLSDPYRYPPPLSNEFLIFSGSGLYHIGALTSFRGQY